MGIRDPDHPRVIYHVEGDRTFIRMFNGLLSSIHTLRTFLIVFDYSAENSLDDVKDVVRTKLDLVDDEDIRLLYSNDGSFIDLADGQHPLATLIGRHALD